MSVLEKDEAALVTRPRSTPNDQTPQTVRPLTDVPAPPARSAARRFALNITLLFDPTISGRERELLVAENRDLLRRFPELDKDIRRSLDSHAPTGAAIEPEWIAVPELAAGIGRTDATTRKLLDRGLIPGAGRKTPGKKNSPWLIPATAPAAFLANPGGTNGAR